MGFLLRESKSTYKKKQIWEFPTETVHTFETDIWTLFQPITNSTQFCDLPIVEISGILLYECMPMGKLEVLGLSKYIYLRPLKRLLGTLWCRLTVLHGHLFFQSLTKVIYTKYSKQFKWNSYIYVSGQSRPFWAALKLL